MQNYPHTHRKKVFVEPIGMNHLSTSIRMYYLLTTFPPRSNRNMGLLPWGSR